MKEEKEKHGKERGGKHTRAKFVITSKKWGVIGDALKAGYKEVASLPSDTIIAVTTKILKPDEEYILYESESVEIDDIIGQTAVFREQSSRYVKKTEESGDGTK